MPPKDSSFSPIYLRVVSVYNYLGLRYMMEMTARNPNHINYQWWYDTEEKALAAFEESVTFYSGQKGVVVDRP